MENAMNQLTTLKLFAQVEQSTIDKLWNTGKTAAYQKGEHCFRAKENNVNIYILLTGKAAIYNLTHSGKRKTIFYLGSGALLNDHILKNSLPAVSCESVDESVIFSIKKDDFLNIMQEDFNLTQAVLEDYERKMFRMSHQLKNTLGCVYLERKIASKLWKLSRDFGVETPQGLSIDIPLSITELADFVGAPRESTSRALKKLTEKGMILVESKKIYVKDTKKLSRYYKTGKME